MTKKNTVSFELNSPYKTRQQKVLPEWIDYNGHMNVAYYTLAFDKSLDFFFEDVLGIGPTYVSKMSKGPFALKASYHYFSELLVREEFYVDLSVVDFDSKRLHICGEMKKSLSGELSAVFETVLMNVDLNKRKSIEYPKNVLEIFEKLKAAMKTESLPNIVGKAISLKR